MASFRQELPPPGGYQPIEWVKQASFKSRNGFKILGGVLVLKACGLALYYYKAKQRMAYELEMNDARIALAPLMLAEADRSYLKFIRSMREEEEELMKDVPNWKTGMLYDKPIYHTADENELRLVSRAEQIAFSKSTYARGNLGLRK